MKLKKCALLALPAAAVILELLPWGAVLNFANPEGEPWRQTFSYFSMVPFGYANFGPLLTALLSCVLVVLGLVFLGRDQLLGAIRWVSAVAVATSLMPLMFGLRSFSALGAAITAVLLAQMILAWKP